jgi:hypothetical protein
MTDSSDGKDLLDAESFSLPSVNNCGSAKEVLSEWTSAGKAEFQGNISGRAGFAGRNEETG